jgi:UDP-arabinose 4-epimerase
VEEEGVFSVIPAIVTSPGDRAMLQSILVTGGAGYVGSHACKALAAAGYRPIVYDSLSRGHQSAVKWGPLIEGDLHERDRLVAAMRAHRVEAVMHFAAFAYVGESVGCPELYYRNNVVGTLSLLDAMREAGVATIVFSSTCAVYGVPETVPIRETTAKAPLNPYGETKLAIERVLHWYGAANNAALGLRYAALRYFNAAGTDPDGEVGENHEPETHLIPLILRAALGRGDPLQIFGTDYPTRDGTAIRDYIHVTDLADAHVRALARLAAGSESMELNLGTGSGHSVREVIAAVERVVGRPVPCREAPRRPGDPPELVADAALARERLGWHPRHSDLDTIVRTALTWETRPALAG